MDRVPMKKFGQPQIINAGDSIAREIELLDNIENTGVLGAHKVIRK